MAKQLYLIDTCSFVQQHHHVECAKLMDELILRGQFVLSSVVAMELYAGTKNKQAKNALDLLGLKLDEVGLLATPTYHDYQRAGIILRNYSARKGSIKSSTHFRDILICLNAMVFHAIIITENCNDFLRWTLEIKRNFKRELKICTWQECV